MTELPKRKNIRIPDFDYSTHGAYFITVCTANREKIFWSDRRGDLWSPANNEQTGDPRSPLRVELSDVGMIVENEIKKMNTVYDAVRVDKYCVMSDHIHFILSINTDENGRPQVAPTVSREVQQFKGSVTKQVGDPSGRNPFMTTEYGISGIMRKSGDISRTIH